MKEKDPVKCLTWSVVAAAAIYTAIKVALFITLFVDWLVGL